MWQQRSGYQAGVSSPLLISLWSLRSIRWTLAGGRCCRCRAPPCRSRCTPPCRPRRPRPTPRDTRASPSSRPTCPESWTRSDATWRSSGRPPPWTRSWRRSRPRPRHKSPPPRQSWGQSGQSNIVTQTPGLSTHQGEDEINSKALAWFLPGIVIDISASARLDFIILWQFVSVWKKMIRWKKDSFTILVTYATQSRTTNEKKKKLVLEEGLVMKFYLLPDLTVLSLPDWTIDVESSNSKFWSERSSCSRTDKEAADNVHLCTGIFLIWFDYILI